MRTGLFGTAFLVALVASAPACRADDLTIQLVEPSRFAPDLATVQLFPAGSNAWVLLYVFKAGPIEQLKAHVFSGNGKGHCLEIHMSRTNATEAQRQAWMSAFRGIAVSAE